MIWDRIGGSVVVRVGVIEVFDKTEWDGRWSAWTPRVPVVVDEVEKVVGMGRVDERAPFTVDNCVWVLSVQEFGAAAAAAVTTVVVEPAAGVVPWTRVNAGAACIPWCVPQSAVGPRE